MKLKKLEMSLRGLCCYHDLLDQEIIEPLLDLLDWIKSLEAQPTEEDIRSHCIQNALHCYGKVFYLLRDSGYTGFGDYLQNYLLHTTTLYGKMVTEGRKDPALEYGAKREIETLMALSKLDGEAIFATLSPYLLEEDRGVLADLPRLSSHCPFDFDSLTQTYQTQGCGIFAKHRQFVWRDERLIPVEMATPRPYNQMQGYAIQREQVLKNTQALVAGQKAQNILLFGDGGTGKSAVVKSMLGVEAFTNLRIIQIENHQIRSLPTLMSKLESKHYRFILFIDDLSFDQDDNTYSAMKSMLEGGLEAPPDHVRVYATSNRRHLVRQTFSDRAGDEVDMMETISEKTALSERFGLRIPYLSMKKEEYLSLVDYLYETEAQSGLMPHIPKNDLYHKAMMWEIRHGGRTPRVANQYICSLKQLS